MMLMDAAGGAGAGVGEYTWPGIIKGLVDKYPGLSLAIIVILLLIVLSFVGLFIFILWKSHKGVPVSFWGISIGAKSTEDKGTTTGGKGVDSPLRGAVSTAGVAAADSQAAGSSGIAQAGVAFALCVCEIILAPDQETAEKWEGQLLTALLKEVSQKRGLILRAAIFKIKVDGDDTLMIRSNERPNDHFMRSGDTQFSRKNYETYGQGLVWHAALEALKQYSSDPIGQPRYVLPVEDIEKSPNYLKLKHGHRFRSILIAPILSRVEQKTDTPHILGAVCLDSSDSSIFSEEDKQILSMTAVHLAVAWKLREWHHVSGSR